MHSIISSFESLLEKCSYKVSDQVMNKDNTSGNHVEVCVSKRVKQMGTSQCKPYPASNWCLVCVILLTKP